MSIWYKQKALSLISIAFFSQQSVEIAAAENSNSGDFNWFEDSVFVDSNQGELSLQFAARSEAEDRIVEILQLDNWLAKKQNSCQNVNSAYQQVYSFETDNYYINICQLENNFYYHRQAKFDDDSPLLIPAQLVSHNGVFQANSKGTTYFVGRDGDRYYSSVMLNDNEIVFEPELQLSPDSVLARDVAEANSQLPADGDKADRATNASVEFDRPQENLDSSQQTSICTGANTLNSRLDSWQQLLGESLDKANQYALDNGHSFVYDAQTPEQASITTKEGAIVNLNIATTGDTIESVCIRTLAEN